MMTGNKNRIFILIVAVFVLASVLRISLALVNREAKDRDFIDIISRIADNEPPSHPYSCPLCNQPKLYFYFTASVFKLLSVDSKDSRIVTAQLVNCAAGIMTLVVALLFLDRFGSRGKFKLIAFSAVALNPRLIGINSQVTPDTFVILFGCLAVYYLFCFWRDREITSFLLLSVFSVFAMLSKPNALVIYIAVFATMLVMITANLKNKGFRKKIIAYFLIFNFLVFSHMAIFGDIFSNTKPFGWPIVPPGGNRRPPLPHFFEKTYFSSHGEPAIISVFDSYFTFRIIDLVRNPTTDDLQTVPHPKYSTSFWSLLYGRLNFIRFPAWPASWATDNSLILNIGRAIFILAIFPLMVLIYGFFLQTKRMLLGLREKKWDYFNDYYDWIFLMTALGFLAFVMLYAMLYRDYCKVKVIYLFPGMLAFIKIFHDGLKRVYGRLSLTGVRALDITFMLLFGLYIADTWGLIIELWGLNIYYLGEPITRLIY